MVPDAIFTSTHAITIDAPREHVWPWIAQMGCGRAGWYSWDVIDNGGTRSSRKIEPGLQAVGCGDIMPAVPGAADAFVVAAVDPPGHLVLTVPDGHGDNAVAWEHFLEPIEGGRTRLIVRGRASSGWLDLAQARPGADRQRLFIERAYSALARLPRPLLIAFAALGHRVMEARHLRGIRRRSTAAWCGSGLGGRDRGGGWTGGRRILNVFAGQKVGVKQVDEHVWLVTFTHYDLGYLTMRPAGSNRSTIRSVRVCYPSLRPE